MSYRDPERQRRYQRERCSAKRNAWLLANGPCVQCGSWERLEVDHVDPAQKVSHRIWSWSEKRRLAELAKCQVLCADCHKEKTSNETRTKEHGTLAMYSRGCRCNDCRAANNKKNKGSGPILFYPYPKDPQAVADLQREQAAMRERIAAQHLTPVPPA